MEVRYCRRQRTHRVRVTDSRSVRGTHTRICVYRSFLEWFRLPLVCRKKIKLVGIHSERRTDRRYVTTRACLHAGSQSAEQ